MKPCIWIVHKYKFYFILSTNNLLNYTLFTLFDPFHQFFLLSKETSFTFLILNKVYWSIKSLIQSLLHSDLLLSRLLNCLTLRSPTQSPTIFFTVNTTAIRLSNCPSSFHEESNTNNFLFAEYSEIIKRNCYILVKIWKFYLPTIVYYYLRKKYFLYRFYTNYWCKI